MTAETAGMRKKKEVSLNMHSVTAKDLRVFDYKLTLNTSSFRTAISNINKVQILVLSTVGSLWRMHVVDVVCHYCTAYIHIAGSRPSFREHFEAGIVKAQPTNGRTCTRSSAVLSPSPSHSRSRSHGSHRDTEQ